MATTPDFYDQANAEARTAYPYGHPDNSLGKAWGGGIRNIFDSPWASPKAYGAAIPFNHGPAVGALAGGAGLGALGAGWDAYRGDGGHRGAIIGALLGALGGGVSGYLRKSAFASSGAAARDYALMRVASDGHLPPDTKQELLAAISTLPEDQVDHLSKLLRTAAGAGVGALVARFLMGTGTTGTVLGGVFGGWAANRMAGPSMLGNPGQLDHSDIYGNRSTL